MRKRQRMKWKAREVRVNKMSGEEGKGIACKSIELNLDGVCASWSIRVLEWKHSSFGEEIPASTACEFKKLW